MRFNISSDKKQSAGTNKIRAKQIVNTSLTLFRLVSILFFTTYCDDKASFSMNQPSFILVEEERGAMGGFSQQKQITINRGNRYTRDLSVNLILNPTNDANEMMVTSKANCSEGTWEPLKENKAFKLENSNSVNSVYVKFRYFGQEETSCFSASIIHDNIPPEVSFTNKPGVWTSESSLRLGLKATDPGESASGVKLIECSKNRGTEVSDFETCGENVVYTSLADNREYLLTARAEDQAGNISSVQQARWRSDQTAPEVSLSSGPEAVTSDTNAQFIFSSSDTGSGVDRLECRLDSGSFEVCQSPKSYQGLSEGDHTFSVRAIDEVGHISTLASHSWSIAINVSKQLDYTVLDKFPVDILFVVDTSGSMDTARTKMASKLNSFMDQIKDMDWQLAATTTSLNKYDGRLGNFTPNEENGTYILDSSMTNAQELFVNLIQTGGFPKSEGDPKDEAGIHATYRAIERYNDNESPHTSFFRQGAYLAVVLLSDEEAQGSYSPQNFVKFFRTSFPNKTLLWHSIVNHKNNVDNQGFVGTGHIYKELSRLTQGIIGDVNEDYTEQLKKIGEGVKNLEKEVNLGCSPVDDDQDGNIDMVVKFKASGSNSYKTYSGNSYKIDGERIIFNDYLSAGDFRFQYKCTRQNNN